MRISCDMATAAGPPGYYVHQADSGLHARVLGGGPRWFRPLVPDSGAHEACEPMQRWYWGQTDLLRGVGARPVTFFNEPCDIDRLSASPYDTLYRRVSDELAGDLAARAGVFEPGGGFGPVLPRPSDVLMMQGWLYEPDPVTGRMQVYKNSLLLINVSAIRSLANLVGGPDVRELLTRESRTVLCFHRLDDAGRAVPPSTRWRVARSVHQPHLVRERITSDTTYRGYDCRLVEVDDSVETPTPEDHEAMVEWERVARRLPAAEQVRLLKMALPRELVETGFAGTEFDCYL